MGEIIPLNPWAGVGEFAVGCTFSFSSTEFYRIVKISFSTTDRRRFSGDIELGYGSHCPGNDHRYPVGFLFLHPSGR